MTFDRVFQWLRDSGCDFITLGNDKSNGRVALKIVAPNGRYWVLSPPYGNDIECPDDDLQAMIIRFQIGIPERRR